MSAAAPIGLAEINGAWARVAGTVLATPVSESPQLSTRAGVPVYLKLEHHQITGSFKLRGATNAVLNLSDEQRGRGIVGVSTGNHGRGLGYAARANGVRCIVCVSELVPRNKVDGIKAQGAEVRIVGKSQDDAQVEAERLRAEEDMTMVPPFDHPDIIAGQGTIGLELMEQVPNLETVVIQVSGGGLIAGIAAALKASKPGVRVIGISMERGAAMYESLKAGEPYPSRGITDTGGLARRRYRPPQPLHLCHGPRSGGRHGPGQ